jgi:hypothetical protein
VSQCSMFPCHHKAEHSARLLVLRRIPQRDLHGAMVTPITNAALSAFVDAPAGLHDASDLVDLGGQAAGSDEARQFLIHEVWPDAKCCRHGAQLHAFVRLQELQHVGEQLQSPVKVLPNFRSNAGVHAVRSG